MSYRKKTNFYEIPYMGAGDRMTEQENAQQWTILDNLLYASTFGVDKCFLQDGAYQLQYKKKYCTLKIKPFYEDGFSLLGVINKRLFYSKNQQKVQPLLYDHRYYIYLQASQYINTNPQAFFINAYTVKQELTAYNLLLCVVETTTPSQIITDVNKVYAKNLLSHTKDTTNPHGKQMHQYNLNVVNNLTLRGENINPAIYTSYVTTDKEYVLPFPEGKQVLFVSAYPESIKAGYIAWRIENKNIILSNAGQSGIKVNLKLDVR